jgi:hypothetical protein
MGYDVYITRVNSRLKCKSDPILSTEWERVLEADPTLEISSEDYHQRYNFEGEMERIDTVYWNGPNGPVALWFMDGAIQSKNPNISTLDKLTEIAGKLESGVIGEEGEVYGPDGYTYDAEDQTRTGVWKLSLLPRWKRWWVRTVDKLLGCDEMNR